MSAAVVCGHKSDGSSLNHLELGGQFFSVGVPDSGCILYDGAHISLIGFFFDGTGQLARFLCKNALTLLAFLVILFIWGFQLKESSNLRHIYRNKCRVYYLQ